MTGPMADEDRTTGTQTAFDRLGGEVMVRRLVDRFYDLMELEPAYAALRAMHPTTLEGSRDKLFWFLCGWLGGPDHYIQRFGHPRLRMRHMPFVIAERERQAWLGHMLDAVRLSVEAAGLSADVEARLVDYFTMASAHLVNS